MIAIQGCIRFSSRSDEKLHEIGCDINYRGKIVARISQCTAGGRDK